MSGRARSALVRWCGLFGFWLALAAPGDGAGRAIHRAVDLAPDLAIGALAAAAAAWVSLRLLPPRPGRLRWGALTRLAARVLRQSVVSGIDVARRALDPRLPLAPGLLVYPVRIPPGPARALFGALTGLVPGTVPVGSDARGRLVYHCLDTGAPVAATLADDEALLLRALGGDSARGADGNG